MGLSRRLLEYLMMIVLGVIFTGWLSWSIFTYMEGAGSAFESAWVKVDHSKNHVVRIPHTLGRVPRELTVWFSPTNAGTTAYLVTTWSMDTSGNPVSIWADRSAVMLSIFSGMSVRGTWAPETEWTRYPEGFFKVVAR